MPSLYRRCTRSVKHFFQRLFRGFDDRELWNLDITIAEFVLPRLKRFKQRSFGYPAELTPEQWDEYLHKMINSFEFVLEQNENPSYDEKEWEKAKEGLSLFAKYYSGLWE